MKNIFIIILTILFCSYSYGQDAAVSAHSSPASGCNLTSTESVNVTILNKTGSPILSGSLVVKYQINGGTVHSQALASNINAHKTWNCHFTDLADLSGCDTDYDFTVWLEYSADTDPTNDTLKWTVRNDCTVVPGDVQTDQTVCSGNNSNTLNLVGRQHGTIANWMYSEDGGNTWTNVSNTSTSLSFTNLTSTREYAVVIDGGYCVDDTSDFATVTSQLVPSGGTLSGVDTVCVSSASGTINLSGTVTSILDWEKSTDNGITWIGLGNTTTSYNYSGLTQDTWYRAKIDGGVCADVYSDTLKVHVDQLSNAGTIGSNQTLCKGSPLNLSLTSYNGDTIIWQVSNDGTTWTKASPLTNSTTFDVTSMTQDKYFRVKVVSGVCPEDYTSKIFVQVQDSTLPGNIIGDTAVCISNANGTLTLSGNVGTISSWESSTDNGGSWNTITNNTTTQNYSGLTQETWYRVLIDGGACPDTISDTIKIQIDAVPTAGSIGSDTSLCQGGSLNLLLDSYSGDTIAWEISSDGSTWTTAPNSTNSDQFTTGNITSPTYFRAKVENGACADAFSNELFVQVDDTIIPGTLNGSTELCITNANGTLSLNGGTGTIGHWESSINGTSWDTIPTTTPSLNFNNLTQTTQYRVFYDGGICPDKYSTIAVVKIDKESDAGNIIGITPICKGYSDTLTLQSNTGDITKWEYSTDGTNWLGISTTDSVYVISNVNQPYYFHVIVKNGVCPEDTTASFFVDTLAIPIVSAGADTTLKLGDTLQLHGSGGQFGIWTPGNTLSDSTIYSPLAFPTKTTTYTLYVVSMNNCYNSDNVTIKVEDPLQVLDVKNVITPNNDDYNDTWIIQGSHYFPSIQVEVYNIYGQEVFSDKDYKNDWSGEYKGKPLPDGTYYYIVKVNGIDKVLKGNLTILGNE